MFLSDFVRVTRRFQRAIRVDADLADVGAVEGFISSSTAAEALVVLARHVSETMHGAFTWTGPYGGGKSSLAVAFGALLGPIGPRRNAAMMAFGADVTAQVYAALPPTDNGWTVVPVVGRRGEPAAVIEEALDEVLGKKKGRRRTSSQEGLIERLAQAAAEAPGGGLLIVIDEMGKFLEEAASGEADVYFFQRLAEAASDSKGRLVVVGILHQAFDDYAHRLAREIRDEWLKIQGRYVDIPLNIIGDEQIELIARAIDCTDRPDSGFHHAAGIAAVVRKARPSVRTDFKQQLYECWPISPVVACLLGPLSRRRFGQNQRSVFGFLNSLEPYGFQDFLRSTPAASPTMYEPARLWEYLRANLEPSILASSDGHRWSLAVEAVERCEARGGDADHLQTVKTIAVIDLFKERSGLVASPEVLGHALPHLEKSRLENLLNDLKTWSVIIYKRHLGAYAVYAGSDFDIDAAVDDARARMTGLDFGRLRSLALLQPVLAKRHYHMTGALRWFDVDIAPLSDGLERVKAYKPQDGATGLFLLLIGMQGEGESAARRMTAQAAAAAVHWPVAIGYSRDSYMIRELATELLSLERVRAERSELNGDAVARREVDSRIANISAALEDRLRHTLVSATWECNATNIPHRAGWAGLNVAASHLADWQYPSSPSLHNELLNRIKPSSNAIAAQKALLKAMVERNSQARLGIVGYPAEGGLFASLLEATHLYRADPEHPGSYCFCVPNGEDPCGLASLWGEAERIVRAAGAAGIALKTIYDAWRERPFGLRDGLLPVLGVAFMLSKATHLAVYLDGAFQARLNSYLIDRLTQDAGSVRIRWSEVSEFHRSVLSGVADLVSEYSKTEVPAAKAEPLEVAKSLVAVVDSLKPWALKTMRLSQQAIQVRSLVKMASDPNKFLLDDLPELFRNNSSNQELSASAIVISLREGLTELIFAYPRLMRNIEKVMLDELKVSVSEPYDFETLRRRAEAVRGLTGNYRLDAFATRLCGYSGTEKDVEGLASLAANKPPRDWVDRDADQASMEIAALAQEFVRAEGFAHVKGRTDGRVSMAFITSEPGRPSPIVHDVNIASAQKGQINQLVQHVMDVFESHGAGRELVLATVAEISARFAKPGS